MAKKRVKEVRAAVGTGKVADLNSLYVTHGDLA